jgi:leader peptidase (prepilin peptidase) / N-methyltransferase
VTAIGILACGLAGWLAGAAANWAADVLPKVAQRPGDANIAPGGGDAEALRPHLWHYLTLGWYAFRRGICPRCGQRRPLRAPLLEGAIIVTFVLAGWRFASSPLHTAVVCLYAAFLLAVLVIDLEHRRVLNVMLAPAAVSALLIGLLPGYPDLLQALLGGAIGFGAFALLALIGRGAMGYGDVKLAGVIGLMTGVLLVGPALVIGVLLGGLAAILLLVTRRAGRKSSMAYAPYLALGTIIVLLIAG